MTRYCKSIGIFTLLVFLLTMAISPLTASAAGEPVINGVTLSTNWFNPGNTFHNLVILTDTTGAETVTAKIYDAGGNFVDQTKVEDNIGDDGLVELHWDGKISSGYVPATAAGTVYKLQVEAVNGSGTTKGEMLSFKVTLQPTVSMLLSYDSYTTEPTAPLNPMITLNTTVTADLIFDVYSKDGSIKYAELTQSAPEGKTYWFEWDGKATEAVAAEGIAPGDYLPASESGIEYKIVVTAVNQHGLDDCGASIKMYPKPTITGAKVYPTSSYGFVLGYPNKLRIEGVVKAPPSDSTVVHADIYNATGNILFSIGYLYFNTL